MADKKALSINGGDLKKKSKGVRISFAARTKPLPVKGFIISDENSVKFVARNIMNYRKPVLVKDPQGWYIKYYYRIPLELRPTFNNKVWHRFRIKEDMNRRKGAEREEYADWLLSEITVALKKGFNPFSATLEMMDNGDLREPEGPMSVTAALNLFLKEWETRGLDPLSFAKYRKYIHRFIDWLIMNHIQEKPVTEITTLLVKKFIQHNKDEHNLSNREYNNSLMFLRTTFKYLVKEKIIPTNPALDVDKQKAVTKKHRYYDTAALDLITRVLQTKDPYCYFAFQVIYHLCIRSEKELKHFRIGNILWDQSKVFIDIGKADTQRYIPMNDEIKRIFLEHGLDKYPPQYYVFSGKGKPSDQPFGGTFFAKKFSRVKKFLKMDDDFTLYGAKHTKVVHMVQDGAKLADLMAMTGHKDPYSLNSYLRGLGVLADFKRINEISRKV